MNVTKQIAALTLAVLVIPIQDAHGGGPITYIVSQDNPAGLIVTINHPNSTFGSNTFTLAPPLTSWAVTGTLTDLNAGLVGPALGLDSVTLTGMTVGQTVLPGPVFTVPTAIAGPGPALPKGTYSFINYASSAANTAGGVDYVKVGGTFTSSPTNSFPFGVGGGQDINAYNIAVVGDQTLPAAPAPAFGAAAALGGNNTPAMGSLAALYDASTNLLLLDVAVIDLPAADNITDIQITSSDPNFTTLDLGTSGLMTDGLTGDFSLGADVSIPSADLADFEAGNSFVNVLTSNDPTGEIGGAIQVSGVPEPSSFFLLTSGLVAGLAWWRRKACTISGVGPVIGTALVNTLERVPLKSADAFVAFTGLYPRSAFDGRPTPRRAISAAVSTWITAISASTRRTLLRDTWRGWPLPSRCAPPGQQHLAEVAMKTALRNLRMSTLVAAAIWGFGSNGTENGLRIAAWSTAE